MTTAPPAPVVSVIGTRPEAIKMAPVARALDRRGIAQAFVITGQHPGLEPSDHGFDEGRSNLLAIGPGDGDPERLASLYADGIEEHFLAAMPAFVLVQGDTTSALAGAIAAERLAIPLGHVEAGLRTHDLAAPWPEEGHRVAIDTKAALLFAPTDGAAANLIDEGVRGKIFITGNSGIDALLETLESPQPPRRSGRYVLATCHRREHHGGGFERIGRALERIAHASSVPVVLVQHPNPAVREPLARALGSPSAVERIEPRPHASLTHLLRHCALLISDSGGLQEEAATLGVPALILRTATERPEAVESGNAVLVGSDEDAIVDCAGAILSDESRRRAMAVPRQLFGDGRAGERIAEAVAEALPKLGGWTSQSWRSHPAAQQPTYEDQDRLALETRELRRRPGLVSASAVAALRRDLARIAAGDGFLLQAGECAESFDRSAADIVADLSLIDQMAAILAQEGLGPVTRLARLAGQFAKPRSETTEARTGVVLPVYRGDLINGRAFTPKARHPDPTRFAAAYRAAGTTLGLIETRKNEPIYASHEALLLAYESAYVRHDATIGPYAASAHLLWLGYRSAGTSPAHGEFVRGLANPLAVKCGPGLDPATLEALLEAVDRERTPGRITLISRLGPEGLDALPGWIEAVRRGGWPVLWSCDPMHGNGVELGARKTRHIAAMEDELRHTCEIHAAEGSRVRGLCLETTAQPVTECIGGAVTISRLSDDYRTGCDPRLNADQAVAFVSRAAEILGLGLPGDGRGRLTGTGPRL